MLKLTLHPNSYDFAFLKANGTNNDAGTFSCHSAPVFTTDLADRSDVEGAAVALDADAGDNDGDALTYSATNLPPGVSINASTGVIGGTLAAASAGVRTVTVTVTDGSATDTDTFVWTVTAAPSGDPVLIGAGDIASTGPGAGQTAAIIAANPPAAVSTLGDNPYPNGSACQLHDLLRADLGRLQGPHALPRGRQPRVQHAGATGHYGYFGAAAHGPNGYCRTTR